MNKQEVLINFPRLVLKIADRLVIMLQEQVIVTNSIDVIRKHGESIPHKFTKDLYNKLYREIGKGLSASEESFTLPEISLWGDVEDEPLYISSPWSINCVFLNASLHKTITDLIYHSIIQITKKALSSPITVKLITDDVETDVQMEYKHNYHWDFPISSTQLKNAAGGAIKIRYGNYLHNVLWHMARGTKRNKLGKETIIALKTLDLVDNSGKVTEKGRQVLTTLDQFDPATQPELVQLFTASLLDAQDNIKIESPTMLSAYNNGYLDKLPDSKLYITSKGIIWLKANCGSLISKQQYSKSRRKELIPYLPLEALAPFLADDEQEVRDASSKRVKELQKEQQNGQ
ncbi:MAG TPA: hypothetical protein VMV86_01225 [Methanosarcinales archaeon]|nr:hypothetical protein [Methanosarcinales archaeon]